MTAPALVGGFCAPAPVDAPAVANVRFAAVACDSVAANTASGTGDSFAKSGSNVILTDAGAAFVADAIGQYIVIEGATSSANNGTFPVSARTATTITFANASGVAESFPGTWSLLGRCSQLADRKTPSRVFSQATATARPQLKRSTLNAAKLCWTRSDATATWLALNDTSLAGLFNGNTACSFAVKVAHSTPSGTLDYLAIAELTNSNSNAIYCRENLATNIPALWRYESGAGSILTSPASTGSVTVGWVYRTSGECEFFVASPGSSASIGSSAAGTIRSPASMAYVVLGSANNFGIDIGGEILGWCAGTGVAWTAANFLTIENWFAAKYA